MTIITCIAPVNIAVIKYWGKRDEALILPLNDSISSTLSADHMCAKTTIMASPQFKENKIWLNGKEESFDNPRLLNCLKELKCRAETSEITSWKIHVCSENNFPTASGLASSAAGYACFVFALAHLYGVQGDISDVARRGSGSACRSIFGGWVQWHAGNLSDGSDSIATQLLPSSHWPELRIIILVVNDKQKKYSSTKGMQLSVLTSPLLKHRVKDIVPKRVSQIIQALQQKDFETFAKITMQDSNQFHSICLDTFPPCTYMNDVSHAIVELIHSYNEFRGSSKVAYTFDAGPNACLYLLEQDVPEVVGLIRKIFPPNADAIEYIKGIPVDNKPLNQNINKTINLKIWEPDMIKYIIHTKVGDGPSILEEKEVHLLNSAGLPTKLI